MRGVQLASENDTLFDLGLPDKENFDQAMASLTPEGRARFYTEVVASLYEVQKSGSLQALQDTAQAWYRSAAFLAKPGFKERLQEAGEDAKRLVGR